MIEYSTVLIQSVSHPVFFASRCIRYQPSFSLYASSTGVNCFPPRAITGDMQTPVNFQRRSNRDAFKKNSRLYYRLNILRLGWHHSASSRRCNRDRQQVRHFVTHSASRLSHGSWKVRHDGKTAYTILCHKHTSACFDARVVDRKALKWTILIMSQLMSVSMSTSAMHSKYKADSYAAVLLSDQLDIGLK